MTMPLYEQKTCQMDWYIPQKVLQLTIVGVYTPEDAEQINDHLLEELGKATNSMTLVIDATAMERPTNFEIIRQSQAFMHHPMLGQIYVASNSRLIRFAMMIIFNTAAAGLRMFDTLGQARVMADAMNTKRP